MSYVYRVLNDRPSRFFTLESDFTDATGGTAATVTGTPRPAPPLVIGGGGAYATDGANYFSFLTNIFYTEPVTKPFTFEAWFRPVGTFTVGKGILGHASQDDGLSFDGDRITFSTYHSAAGNAVAEYYPPVIKRSFHVVGVHTETKNELYVNGERVASVDLTPEQLATPYLAPSSGRLYSGYRAGEVIIDAVAIYDRALSAANIKAHYNWGTDVPDLRDVVSSRGGTYWTFTDDTTDIAYELKYDKDYEWLSGQSASIRVFADKLTPEFDASGLTTAGTWMGGLILSAVATTIDGSKIEWDGDGNFTVQTSTNNGASWATAVNGRQISGISSGYATAGKSLQVRVVFVAGESATTPSRLRNLTIKLYRNRSSTGSSSARTATFTSSVGIAPVVYQPIEQAEAGVLLYSGGYATIPGYGSEVVRTIETWINLTSSPTGASYLYDANPGEPTSLSWSGTAWVGEAGTTYYVNGVLTDPATMVFTPGRWYHLVAVFPTTTVGNINLGVDTTGANPLPMRFGMFATYPTALTAANILDLYNAYIGVNKLSVTDVTAFSVADDDVPAKVYSYDWSVTGSG
jgi:hypothetical protein